MSISGKARSGISRVDQISDMQKQINLLHAKTRTVNTPQSIIMPPVGSAPPNHTNFASYLKTAGDVMMGPISFNPMNVAISGTSIDISTSSTAYSTNVTVTGSAGSTLNTITGAAHLGQFLILTCGIGGAGLTINNDATANHINLSYGSALTMQLDDVIILQWTSSSVWRQITAGTANLNQFALTSLSNLTTTSINEDLIPHSDDFFNIGSNSLAWLKVYTWGTQIQDAASGGNQNNCLEAFNAHYMSWNIFNNSTLTNAGYEWFFASNLAMALVPEPVGGLPKMVLDLENQNIYTSATAGTATALPSPPKGYLLIKVNGTSVKVPYYNL